MSKIYFVSYTFISGAGKQIHGNAAVTIDKGIENIDDLRRIELGLEQRHAASQVIINNWREFDSE